MPAIETLIERNISDGFLEEGDSLEGNSLSVTEFGNLAIVHNMKSGKRVIEVTNISTDDLEITPISAETNEEPV